MDQDLEDRTDADREDQEVRPEPHSEEGEEHTDQLTKDIDDGQHEVEDKYGDEPYSSQVLRRIHQDKSILMQHYDEMNSHLEHKEIKAWLESLLEWIEGKLTEAETLHATHHPHLPPLEGGMPPEPEQDEERGMHEKPEDEHERDKDRPTPDEALEGMKTKFYQQVKSLCLNHHKSLDGDEEKSLLVGAKHVRERGWVAAVKSDMTGEEKSDDEGPSYKSAQEAKNWARKVIAKALDESVSGHEAENEHEEHEHHHESKEEEHEHEAEEMEHGKEPHISKVLLPHHHKSLEEAAHHLKKHGEGEDYTDEEARLNHHYHGKALDDVADHVAHNFDEMDKEDEESEVQAPGETESIKSHKFPEMCDALDVVEVEGKKYMRVKDLEDKEEGDPEDIPGHEVHQEHPGHEETEEELVHGEKGLKAHYKTLRGAAKFLKGMAKNYTHHPAHTKSFIEWHNSLEDLKEEARKEDEEKREEEEHEHHPHHEEHEMGKVHEKKASFPKLDEKDSVEEAIGDVHVTKKEISDIRKKALENNKVISNLTKQLNGLIAKVK